MPFLQVFENIVFPMPNSTPTTPINNTANTIGISIRFIKYLYGCINTSPVSGFTAKPSTNNKRIKNVKKKTRNKIVSGINCFRLLATISGSSILLINRVGPELVPRRKLPVLGTNSKIPKPPLIHAKDWPTWK